MTYLIILALVAIIGSLIAALVFMLRGDSTNEAKKGSNMARALAFRVGFSILLFLCILVAWKLGYIRPTGIAAGR